MLTVTPPTLAWLEPQIFCFCSSTQSPLCCLDSHNNHQNEIHYHHACMQVKQLTLYQGERREKRGDMQDRELDSQSQQLRCRLERLTDLQPSPPTPSKQFSRVKETRIGNSSFSNKLLGQKKQF